MHALVSGWRYLNLSQPEVQAEGRDQHGQTLEELQGRQVQIGVSIGLRLAEAIGA